MVRRAGVFVVLGWLLLAAMPLAQGQTPFALTDPQGDAALGVEETSLPANAPDADTAAYIDMVGLSFVDVDEEKLAISLKNSAGFVPVSPDSQLVIGNDRLYHYVFFEVPGSAGAPVPMSLVFEHWRGRIDTGTTPRTDWATADAYLCLLASAQSCTDVPLTVDAGTAVATVPKILLTSIGHEGKRYSADKLRPLLLAGDEITSIRVTALAGLIPLNEDMYTAPTVQDRLPDQGEAGPFLLRFPTSSGDLRITPSQTYFIAGEDNLVKVQVDNQAPVKRIVNFSIVQTDQADADWKPRLTSQVAIAPQSSTNLTLRLSPPALGDEAMRSTAFKIRATIVSQPGMFAIKEFLAHATVPLDASHDTFYVHSNLHPGIVGTPLLRFSEVFLYRAEDVPNLNDAPAPMRSVESLLPPQGGARLVHHMFVVDGIPNAARLRAGETPGVQLEFQTSIAFTGELQVDLESPDGILAGHKGPVDLAEGSTTIEVPLVPLDVWEQVTPKHNPLALTIWLMQAGAEGDARDVGSIGPLNISLVPRTSFLRIPLEREVGPVLGSAVGVTLSAAEDTRVFINPEKTQVIEFDLRNEGEEAMTVALEADPGPPPGWSMDVRPGSRFRLDAGKSVRVGVLVTPPASAKEGEIARFGLVAKDVETVALLSEAQLEFTVTSGVDIPEETFEAREEDAAVVEESSSRTPSASFLAGAGALALALLRRRRKD